MFETEERRIAERIKDFIKDKNPTGNVYIMLRNEQILNFDDYRKMVNSGKINPMDAYVDIGIDWITSDLVTFYYPFTDKYIYFLEAYLSKLGFYYLSDTAPATGLKYVAVPAGYNGYLSIELTNLNTAANNTNLRKIVVEVVGEKLVSGEKVLRQEEYSKILDMLKSQRLLAGYDLSKANDILTDYYEKHKKSLMKEVVRIAMDYDRIFQPYRVCYDMDNWKEVDCWSIKL